MNGDRPWAERTYMVVGVAVWLIVTVGVALAVNADAALGWLLCSIALLALIGMARLAGWISERAMH